MIARLLMRFLLRQPMIGSALRAVAGLFPCRVMRPDALAVTLHGTPWRQPRHGRRALGEPPAMKADSRDYFATRLRADAAVRVTPSPATEERHACSPGRRRPCNTRFRRIVAPACKTLAQASRFQAFERGRRRQRAGRYARDKRLAERLSL